MVALLLTAAGAYGVFLIYTSVAFGWRGIRAVPVRDDASLRRRRVDEWRAQAGLADVPTRQLGTAASVLFLGGAVVAFAIFGGIVPAILAGGFAATFPMAAYQQRRKARAETAHEAWPRLIEEMRILTGNAGRSIPQALFEAGASAPAELGPAFAAAHREWLISTDFERTMAVLKEQLADATADAVCETLLIAHDLGGTDVDRRLDDLAQDRRLDAQYRKDVRARQAGVRFARRFVLIVPLGMAFAGLSVGNGRAAYETPTGQLAVAVALGMVVLCWVWAGRIMRLPDEERVFHA